MVILKIFYLKKLKFNKFELLYLYEIFKKINTSK